MKQPEIFYEDETTQLTNGFPFIKIINDEDIPKLLFISAMKDAEINEHDEQVVDLAMQMYINSEILKKSLNNDEYNKVRKFLGLKEI